MQPPVWDIRLKNLIKKIRCTKTIPWSFFAIFMILMYFWPIFEHFDKKIFCDCPFLRYRASKLKTLKNSQCSTAVNNIVITFLHVFYIFYMFRNELGSRCRYRFRVLAVFGRRANKINFNVFLENLLWKIQFLFNFKE